jgi:hypothetical protein
VTVKPPAWQLPDKGYGQNMDVFSCQSPASNSIIYQFTQIGGQSYRVHPHGCWSYGLPQTPADFPSQHLSSRPFNLGYPSLTAEVLDNPSNNRRVLSAISTTAASKISLFARDGTRYPDTLRTNCRAARVTSSSVGGVFEFLRILILRHIIPLYP